MNVKAELTRRTRATLMLSAVAAALCAVAFTAPTASADPVPPESPKGDVGVLFNCATYPDNQSTTRSQALVRAQSWIDARVPYSQSACHSNQYGSYRTDCSGFVSMAWGLRVSYTTSDIHLVSHTIARADLQPGDALNDPGSHVALFVRWDDAAHTKPVVREQAGPNGSPTTERVWSASTASAYTPIRYNNIVDDGQPPLPPSATVLVSQHVADIDGDGRPDVLGLNAGSHDSLWMIPNTSTPGSLTRDTSIHISDGWGTIFNIMLADFDSDGKVDILGRAGDDMLAWRNLSTPGHPSFSGWYHLGTQWGTLNKLLIADFTGDNKPDIGGWNSGSHDQFWVIPNTSTVGNLTRGTSIHVTDGWHTIDTYLLTDYNSDGKTDILGRAGDDLVAWRNTAANGRPSFAPLARLGTGWNAIGKLLIADFTGDGKPDIGGYDRANGNQFWVTPNTSTVGNLTRGDSFFVTDGWAGIHTYMMADYDGDGKTDILGRAGDDLLAWRITHTNNRPTITGWSHLGTGWNTIGTYLTQQQ